MPWERLRQLIEEYLSLEELRTLCFDLRTDYDSLGGEGKSGKVRELIALFRRTGRIQELIDYLAEVRPNVPWNKLQFDNTAASPPSQETWTEPSQQTAPLPLQALPSNSPIDTNSVANWKNWGDHPIVVIIGVIAAIVGIIVGFQTLTGTGGSSLTSIKGTTPEPITPDSIIALTEAVNTATPKSNLGAFANDAATKTATVSTPQRTATPQHQIVFGPRNGSLYHNIYNNDMETYRTGVMLQDFGARITCYNPYDRSEKPWNYGLIFRIIPNVQQYRIYLDSDGNWFLQLVTTQNGHPRVKVVQSGVITGMDVTADGANSLELTAEGEKGKLIVNGQPVIELDLSEDVASGDIFVATGLALNDEMKDHSTRYEDFEIWKF